MQQTYTLQQLTGGKDAILSEVKHLAGQGFTIATIRERTYAVAQGRALAAARELIADQLIEAVEMYKLSNGERPADRAEAEDYDSALDDMVEKIVEPYGKLLSASWLVQNTVDTRVHIPEELSKFLWSFATETWLMLTWKTEDEKGWKMTGSEVLEAIGFTDEDFAAIATQADKEATPAMDIPFNLVINEIITQQSFGCDPDDANLSNLVEQLFDEDDAIACGAAIGLGFNATTALSVVEAVRLAELLNGIDAATFLETLCANELLDIAPEETPAAAPAPEASKPPRASKGRKPGPGPAPGSTVTPDVLMALKAALTDDELGQAVGVARATFNNFVKGRSVFAPSDDAKRALRAVVVAHINGLVAALGDLDGGEYRPIE